MEVRTQSRVGIDWNYKNNLLNNKFNILLEMKKEAIVAVYVNKFMNKTTPSNESHFYDTTVIQSIIVCTDWLTAEYHIICA